MEIPTSQPPLKILHFNDVYDICEKDSHHCGGIARFAGAMKQHKEKDPDAVILFAGDLWSPSKCKLRIFGDAKPVSNKHVPGNPNR